MMRTILQKNPISFAPSRIPLAAETNSGGIGGRADEHFPRNEDQASGTTQRPVRPLPEG